MASATIRNRTRTSAGNSQGNGVPQLQQGDRLTIEEFERRYEAMPELKKAELIDGVVYMSSAVRIDQHGDQHFNLIGWLFLYRMYTPGVQGGDNATLDLPQGMNRPQPDACLRIISEWLGQSSTDKRGYVRGAPELIGEVTASTASYDLHDKLRAFERNRVREYVVWRVEDRVIDWFVLRGNKFRRLGTEAGGIYRSKVLPGLWLDAQALIRGDLQRVHRVVQEGVRTDEHRKFVERLTASKGES